MVVVVVVVVVVMGVLSFLLRRQLWICYPGYAGVRKIERADDRPASTANIVVGLQLGRAEVLRRSEELSQHRQIRVS